MADLLSNRYEPIRKVGDGAIAAIWQGVARGEGGFSRPVALRVLRDPWDRDRAVLGAWAATASELAERASPSVEHAIDFVVTDGRGVVVTEWIEGISLHRWLAAHARDGEPVPWPIATAIAIEVLRGLASAHSISPPIFHEGVDARAVRLARSGSVKLTRFGVAPALAVRGTGRRRLEELGLLSPTPEAARGESFAASSDVFAVGALLFEMLAGRPLLDAAPGDARDEAVLRGDVPDLGAARADVPPLLIAHVERALRVEPSDRFASASAMIGALGKLLQAEVDPPGPEALAAAVAAVLDRPKPEARPQGLAELRTMHVDLAELTVLPRQAAEEASEETESEQPPDASAEEQEAERRPRYRFGYKEKRARLAERGDRKIEPQPSETQPLPLTKRASAGAPKGLAQDKTEMLDADQVDRLTLPEPAPKQKPKGLTPQKTEFLNDSQVERLILPERAKPKKD